MPIKSEYNWTEARLERLKKLYVEKEMSVTQCAKALSTNTYSLTKNQVVGILRRNGISKLRHSSVTKTRKIAGQKKQSKKIFNYAAGKMQDPADATPPRSVVLEITDQDTPTEERVSFFDLGHKHCRWPYEESDGTQTYCGRQKRPSTADQSFSFCPYHQGRASRPPKRTIKV